VAADKPAFSADTFKAGKKIFKRKQCSGCHAIDKTGKGEKGPGLKGIYAQKGPEWLKKWLKDPEGIAKSDEEMKKLAAEYADPMPDPELSDEQFEPLLLFLAYDGEEPK